VFEIDPFISGAKSISLFLLFAPSSLLDHFLLFHRHDTTSESTIYQQATFNDERMVTLPFSPSRSGFAHQG
jgi:hypothetical protein